MHSLSPVSIGAAALLLSSQSFSTAASHSPDPADSQRLFLLERERFATSTQPETTPARSPELFKIALDGAVASIKKEIVDSGRVPSRRDLIEQLVEATIRFEQAHAPESQVSANVEETLHSFADSVYSFDLLRALLNTAPVKHAGYQWATDYEKVIPTGTLRVRIGDLMTASDAKQFEFRQPPPLTLGIMQELPTKSIEESGVNLLQGVHQAILERTDKKKEGVPEKLSIEMECYSAPSKYAGSQVGMTWLDMSLRQLLDGDAEGTFLLRVNSRMTTYTQVPEGNRENHPLYRNIEIRFTFDGTIDGRAIIKDDKIVKRRIDKVARAYPQQTEYASLFRLAAEELDQSVEGWQQQNTFLRNTGQTFKFVEDLIAQSVKTEKGSDGVIKASFGDATQLVPQQGQLMVLDLFAMWCAPCLSGMPKLEKLHADLAKHNAVVVSLCRGHAESDSAGLLELIEKKGYQHPFAIAKPDLFARLGTPFVPVYLIVDSSGKVLSSVIPSLTEDNDAARIYDFIAAYREENRATAK